MRSPVDTFHKPIVISPDPDDKYSPFDEKTTLKTISECPVRVLIRSPLDTFHKPIVVSPDPNTK